MILDTDSIHEIIKTPRNKNLGDYKSDFTRLDVYYNGGDITSEIEKITNFENESQKKLRQKIARSPKDFIHRLLNQFTKVFSAKGGSSTLDIEIDSNKKDLIEIISKLPEGISLNKWMQDYWFEAYVTDPNGLIFIEAEENETPVSYPTYKSINVIHDYTVKWGKLDYLVLKHGKFSIGKKQLDVFRVVDDEKDALYYLEGDNLKEFENEDNQHALFHNKGFVPAILVSDIIDKKTGGRKSFINKIEDLLKEYVRECSVLSIFKFLHAYPKYWQYVSKCTRCEGSGKIKDGEGDHKTCPSCAGKKFNLKLDVSDGIMLPLPKNKETPILAPNVAGFAAPPIEAWGKMEESLDKLEKKMEFTILNTYSEAEKSETATGRFIDTQPLNTQLHNFSVTEETIKERVVDYIAKWMFGNEYGSVSIKNGKRFVCENPDVIWEKYTKAKESKAPITTLDYLYKQYLLSEYQNDTQMYEQKLKEFKIEPLVHFTLQELDALTSNQVGVDKISEKLYFSEWIVTKIDWTKDIEVLKKEFQKFVESKPKKNENNSED
ncbi:hypothetical protein [Tenacibaculum caenipelagi]|uniref:Phage portal protein n=1 Tax=Tenacibaculum caenipelagi TaxID=1325435 RepID=A0A4R6TFZ3_9FLAO|nr:hypothetical protein [Tenacibaculum caenipelagi]TDQ27636.1 hypothetical protein DFQ07_1487 [Tenacibaculum caenipelagi]